MGPACHILFLFFILRPVTSSARALAPPSPSSADLSPPTTILRFIVREPSLAPPSPSPTPSPASSGRNRPNCRRSPLEPLEACSTVDPLLRSSSARTDCGNGFVVEFLVLPGLFPLLWCVAGAGERPPPSPPHLLPPVARCQKLCIVDGPPGKCGRSAGQIRFRPETMLSLVV